MLQIYSKNTKRSRPTKTNSSQQKSFCLQTCICKRVRKLVFESSFCWLLSFNLGIILPIKHKRMNIWIQQLKFSNCEQEFLKIRLNFPKRVIFFQSFSYQYTRPSCLCISFRLFILRSFSRDNVRSPCYFSAQTKVFPRTKKSISAIEFFSCKTSEIVSPTKNPVNLLDSDRHRFRNDHLLFHVTLASRRWSCVEYINSDAMYFYVCQYWHDQKVLSKIRLWPKCAIFLGLIFRIWYHTLTNFDNWIISSSIFDYIM